MGKHDTAAMDTVSRKEQVEAGKVLVGMLLTALDDTRAMVEAYAEILTGQVDA